jgi:CheY-like chemotaxis protein
MREVSPRSVLLVDDDPSVRTLLSIQLKKAGFEGRVAADGIDGLAKLRDDLPTVIISDLEMPRMSGIEFISVVRRRFPFIPVIVLSGSIPKEVRAEAEPDVWLDKGELNIGELLQTLQVLVRSTLTRTDLPQVVPTPFRTRLGFAGYITLTCPDCLRTFGETCTTENNTVERTAVCTHCDARVPFLLESSESA